MNKRIHVTVAYATPEEQCELPVDLQAPITIEEVIAQSDILRLFPTIDLTVQKVGVFGKLRTLTDSVNDGDRIEIYRPLIIDPKEARRNKARKKTTGGSHRSIRDDGKCK